MDFLQKLGGRKFLMALIVIGSAMALELYGKGLSTNMAGFLATVLGTFSVVNHVSTSKFLSSKPTSVAKDVSAQLETIQAQIQQANDPETINRLAGLLSDIQSRLQKIEIVSSESGKSIVNLTSVLTRK